MCFRNRKSEHLLFVFVLILIGCSTQPSYEKKLTQNGYKIKSEIFENENACFLLYNLTNDKFEIEYGEENCRIRLPACSTFKVPLSIMAFDLGILKDEKTPMRWDGQKRFIESWNQDQTSETWMRNSVVWFSQNLTPKIGPEKIKHYLDDFNYGNKDFSGGLRNAWLTISPASDGIPHPTLNINSYEQLEFLKSFWRSKFKVSEHAITMTKKLIFIDSSDRGTILHGKTGSGFLDPKMDLRIGWFIGHIKTPENEYISVLSFTDKEKIPNRSFAGFAAREKTKTILIDNGLW